MSVDFCTLQTYCLEGKLTVYLPKTTVVKILICIETRGSEVDNRTDPAPPDCVDNPRRVLKKAKEFFKKKYNGKRAVRHTKKKCEVKVPDLTLTGLSCQMLDELHHIVSDNSCTFAPKSVTLYDQCDFSATSDWVITVLRRFEEAGTFTFTIPMEINEFYATIIGGGGAGSSGIGGSVNVGGGGGGGSGQAIVTPVINVDDLPSRTISVIVGSGGTESNRNGQGSFILDIDDKTLFSAAGGIGAIGHNGSSGSFGGGGGAPNGRGGSGTLGRGQNAVGRNGGNGGGAPFRGRTRTSGGLGGAGSVDGFGGGGGGGVATSATSVPLGLGGRGGSGRTFSFINGGEGNFGGGGGGGGYFQGNVGTGGNGGTGVITLFGFSAN